MKDERQFANSKDGETRLSRACAVGSDRKSLTVAFFRRHPWLLAWPHATNNGLSAARPPTLRVCAAGRSCHTQPTRPGKSPVRPAAGSGRSSHTRLQQPASRSASGRVLSPPYAAVRPNARFTGARGQRASRPASGAHPERGRPGCCVIRAVRVRPVHQPARAAKAPRGRHSNSHRKPPAAPPTAPHPSRCSSTGGRYRAVTAPLEAEPHLPHQQPQTGSRQPYMRPYPARDNPARNPMPTCDEIPPETCPSDPRAPTKAPCRRRYHQLRSRQQAFGR